MKKRIFLLVIATIFQLFSTTLHAKKVYTPSEELVYKSTPQGDLKAYLFYPNGEKNGQNRALIISFFGGGWAGGAAEQFFQYSDYYASQGIVGISAEYRISSKHKTTPFECVADAKSAIRWARANAKELGIDPNKIILSGGSAGGHIALAASIIEGHDDPNDDLTVSCEANGLILFNPVVDTSKDGCGYDRFGGRDKELSPDGFVRENLPPTIILHGTQDTTVPYENVVRFTRLMREKGNDCTLFSAFGEGHGFFNGVYKNKTDICRNYDLCKTEINKFLLKIGYIDEIPNIERDKVRVACVGNSITFGSGLPNPSKESFPSKLQNTLGENYNVTNFGKPGATLLNNGNSPYINCEEYQELMKFSPDIVIIKLGTNDSKAVNWSKKEQFVENYKALIKKLQQDAIRRPNIYLCYPTTAYRGDDTEYINDAIIRNEIIPMIDQIAEDMKLKIIDTYTPFIAKSELFPDKIHPNSEGAELLSKVIYDTIAQTDLFTE